MQFLPILALGVLMYVLLVRPQQRKVREQRDLVRNVGVGARIQTIGGIVGLVVGADDEFIYVEVSPGVEITFVRAAVGRIIEQPNEDLEDDYEPDAYTSDDELPDHEMPDDLDSDLHLSGPSTTDEHGGEGGDTANGSLDPDDRPHEGSGSGSPGGPT